MKSALILGASGFVGNYLLKELLNSKRYDRVTALVRISSLEPSPHLEEIVFDFKDPFSIESLKPVNHIFCCLGSTIRKAGSKNKFRFVDFELPLMFAKWGEKTKAEYFAIVTAMGANPSSIIFYNKVKGEIEREIKKLDIPTIHIFQPSLILGPRKEFRIGEIVGKMLMKTLNFLMVGSLKKYRGIHAKTIAKGMNYYIGKSNETDLMVIESNEIQKTE